MERIGRNVAAVSLILGALTVTGVGCVGDPEGACDDGTCEPPGGASAEPCTGADCAESCRDECQIEGKRVCEGDGVRECGRHDVDPCLEWGEPVACQPHQTCSDGVCSEADECEDECAEGDRTCAGDGRSTCGQFDEDPCIEWSPAEPCSDGETCDGGRCQGPRECIEEGEDCVCGEDQCCAGHCCPVLFICISSEPNGDFCPFGEGPNG